MKPQRCSWIAAILVLGTFLALRGARAQQAGIRWDILHISSFSPVTLQPGGQAAAATFPGTAKLTLTGSGTFLPEEPDQVTGGGNWVVTDAQGKRLGQGSYQVTELLKWDEVPGPLAAGFVDQIGRAADFQEGLAFLRIAYSDGGHGVLVLLAEQDDLFAAPAAPRVAAAEPAGLRIGLGIAASKDGDYFGQREAPQPMVDGDRVAFHAVVVP